MDGVFSAESSGVFLEDRRSPRKDLTILPCSVTRALMFDWFRAMASAPYIITDLTPTL
jgi:hypothetical protein